MRNVQARDGKLARRRDECGRRGHPADETSGARGVHERAVRRHVQRPIGRDANEPVQLPRADERDEQHQRRRDLEQHPPLELERQARDEGARDHARRCKREGA
jgi:hypothetical protein